MGTTVKKILIVEDNPNNLQLFSILLRKSPVNLITASDGNEALDIIRREKPDLVILDIQIPGVSGIEVLKEIKAEPEFQDIIFIAVTAYAMQGDKEKILAAGSDYYMSKPIDTRQFPKMVCEILDIAH